jgi:hypothetical protein
MKYQAPPPITPRASSPATIASGMRERFEDTAEAGAVGGMEDATGCGLVSCAFLGADCSGGGAGGRGNAAFGATVA